MILELIGRIIWLIVMVIGVFIMFSTSFFEGTVITTLGLIVFLLITILEVVSNAKKVP